jgi:hypothetical protein
MQMRGAAVCRSVSPACVSVGVPWRCACGHHVCMQGTVCLLFSSHRYPTKHSLRMRHRCMTSQNERASAHNTKQNSVRPPKLLASCRSFHQRCTAAVRKREGIPTATARCGQSVLGTACQCAECIYRNKFRIRFRIHRYRRGKGEWEGGCGG